MAKSVKGTQTEKNLLTSFAGESQARMRYTYFASVAKKEGYEQIAAIFTEPLLILQVLSALPWKIFRKLLPANTKNGHWIILSLLILQTKKVSPKSLLCTVTSPLPKRDTKNVIALLSRI